MEQRDLDQLMEAKAKYHERLSIAYSDITFAAKDLQTRLKEAFYTLYPDCRQHSRLYNSKNRWIAATDFLEIDDSNDDILYIQFWEYGQSGYDNDSCINSIPVDMRLLTEEGRKKTVEDWIKNEFAESVARKQQQEEATIRRIKELKAELEMLESSKPV